MAKEEKIQEAYGQDFDILVPNENGWSTKIVMFGDVDFDKYDTKEISHGMYLVRPRSLQDIEDNNGWTYIESENDLPNKDETLYHVSLFDRVFNNPINHGTLVKWYYSNKISHYKPLEKPKGPLY